MYVFTKNPLLCYTRLACIRLSLRQLVSRKGNTQLKTGVVFEKER